MLLQWFSKTESLAPLCRLTSAQAYQQKDYFAC